MAQDPKQEQLQAYLNTILKLQNLYNDAIEKSEDTKERMALIQEKLYEKQQKINILQKEYNNLTDEQKKQLSELIDFQLEEESNLKKMKLEQKEIDKLLNEEIKKRERIVDIGQKLLNSLKKTWEFLQANDKIIRTTTLNLGMSGIKADMLRSSFERTAGYAVRLGSNLQDISAIMEGFADETGRSRVMSAEMVKDIIAIGKGTGLGIEKATKLSAQFELMGVNVKNSMNYVQNVVNESEEMGLNTTKILKNISDNFKQLQTYNFQQGVKGFAQMAEYAEKFKISINDALNAANISRTLEGAIDMVAHLQVMGGEFAKLDMFETLYLSRNDPAKLQEKIVDLTKGLVTLRKNSEGVFEKFISPADRDRLNAAAKALGISNENMTEMALRAFDMEKMSQQMAGMGLSDREKKLIEGAAVFNSETGKFQVQIGTHMKNISELTKEEIRRFGEEKATLEERAKQAMTFDETFKSTIGILKVTLLPILRAVNLILEPVAKFASFLVKLSEMGWGSVTIAAGALLTAGWVWLKITEWFSGKLTLFKQGKNLFSARPDMGGTIDKSIGKKTILSSKSTIGGIGSKIGNGGGKGVGSSSFATGAGIGAAALGIGAGIGAAAAGISLLADSMSKLDDNKAKILSEIVSSVTMFVGIGTALAAAIGVIAVTATAASPGLTVLSGVLMGLGAAAAGIGIGIGAAAAGIGMLVSSSEKAGPAMLQVGEGIGMIALSMLGFTAGSLGLLTFATTMGIISSNADALEKVGNAFANIKAVMSGSEKDFLAVENAVKTISGMDVKKGNMFADLVELLSQPIKVQFDDNSNVNLNNDITLNIDGTKLAQIIIEKHEKLRIGK